MLWIGVMAKTWESGDKKNENNQNVSFKHLM